MIRKAVIVGLTLAAVLLCAIWPVSYSGSIGLANVSGPPLQSLFVGFRDGLAVVSHERRAHADDGPVSLTRIGGRAFGFTSAVVPVWDGNVTVNDREAKVYAPIWAVAMLFAAYPMIVLVFGARRRRRERRRRDDECLECGYKLTGNESGVCPECGTEIERG